MRKLLSVTLTGLVATPAMAGEMAVTVEIPRLDVAEYHRPYLAVWVEQNDQAIANLTVRYDVQKRDNEGTKWLKDMRQWWRRSGRDQTFPIDGVSGPTLPVGDHKLSFDTAKGPLAALKPGAYALVVEAAREVGGRELLRIPFEWPAKAAVSQSVKGSSELGTIALAIQP